MNELTYVFRDAWLQWDRVVPMDAWVRLQQVMTHDIMSSDRGDGEGRMRPSMLADNCARRKMLSFHGYRADEASDTMLVLGELGTWNHYRQQLMGLSTGLLDDIEVPVHSQELLISGSIDGITPDGKGVEIKTVHTDYYRRLFYKADVEKEPLEKHLIQIHAYMRAMNTKQFLLVYLNRSDGEITEFTVTYDSTIDSQLDLIINPLVAHAENGTLPDLLPLCKQMKGTIYNDCLWKEACFNEL